LLPCRWTLETAGTLDPRISALEDDFEEEEEEEEEDANGAAPMEMDDARVGYLSFLKVAHTPVSFRSASSFGLLRGVGCLHTARACLLHKLPCFWLMKAAFFIQFSRG
jgi:hypothetical protein